MINDLREDMLKGILQSLPNLRGLHVVGCSRVDHWVVLKHVVHSPRLESLSMTTTVGPSSCQVIHNPLIPRKSQRTLPYPTSYSLLLPLYAI